MADEQNVGLAGAPGISQRAELTRDVLQAVGAAPRQIPNQK